MKNVYELLDIYEKLNPYDISAISEFRKTLYEAIQRDDKFKKKCERNFEALKC